MTYDRPVDRLAQMACRSYFIRRDSGYDILKKKGRFDRAIQILDDLYISFVIQQMIGDKEENFFSL